MSGCEHQSFRATVQINRLTDTDDGPVIGYSADVTVGCEVCGEAFVFIGLPPGVGKNRACASIDGTEARLPIGPASLASPFAPAAGRT